MRRPNMLASIMVTGFVTGATQGPAVWQADVRIQGLEATEVRGALSVQVTVINDNAAPAANTRLEVFLPVRTGPLQMAGGCQASPSAMATVRARVSCALGDLAPGQPKTVWLTTNLPPAGGSRRVGAVAFSDTPDPMPANNFAERAIP